MDHVISADEFQMIEIQKKTMDFTREVAELFCCANTKGAQPFRVWGQHTMESSIPVSCSRNSTRSSQPWPTGRSPHRLPWLESPWPFSWLAWSSGRNASASPKTILKHQSQLHQHLQCQLQTSLKGLSRNRWPTIRPPNLTRPFPFTSTSHRETFRRKGDILEQYSKQGHQRI